MELRQKIEAEIGRLERELESNTIYDDIKRMEYELECLKQDLQKHPTYQALLILKNLLTETPT